MIQIGKKRIVIKPATIVLLLGATVAAITPFLLSRPLEKSERDAAWEYVNVGIWKFEVRRNAQVELRLPNQEPQTLTASKNDAHYKIDLRSGIRVAVKKTDGAPDSVDIRNTLNFESLKNNDNLVVRFRAQADSPHEIIFILREYGKVAWSARHTIGERETLYSMPISFRSCKTFQGVLSIHLGGSTGALSIREFRIEPRE